MRQYLVHAYAQLPDTLALVPFNSVIHLEDNEIFDAATLASSQQLLSDQNGAAAVQIVSFQPLETPPAQIVCEFPAMAPSGAPSWDRCSGYPGVQLNDCGTVLPPVDSPLVIEIAEGVLLKAYRPEHAEHKGDQLVFNVPNGGKYIGRPRWTHA